MSSSCVEQSVRKPCYRTLLDEQRRALDNTFIQAIIVTSDGTKESLDSIYNIFERLNSGGTQLTPHEIRVALYAGKFIGFLEELNTLPDWRELYGKKSPRLRDQELVLRIIGIYLKFDNYKRPLKRFLNQVVSEFRESDSTSFIKLKSSFEQAAKLLLQSYGKMAIRLGGSQVNVAFAEAVMVGLITRLASGKALPSASDISSVVDKLKSDPNVKASSSRATADEENVHRRVSTSKSLFGEI